MVIGIMSLLGVLGGLYLVSLSVVWLHILWLVVIGYSVGVGWLFVHSVLCPLS